MYVVSSYVCVYLCAFYASFETSLSTLNALHIPSHLILTVETDIFPVSQMTDQRLRKFL